MGSVKNLILEEAEKSKQKSFKFNAEEIDEKLLFVEEIDGVEYISMELHKMILRSVLEQVGWDVTGVILSTKQVEIDERATY